MSNQENSWIYRRRIRNGLILFIVLAILFLWVVAQRNSLQDASFSTGYVLIGAVFFLAAFNWRKKLPFLAFLGRGTTWMQLHIYVGFGAIAIFLLHIGLKIPNGFFEQILAALFLVVAGSGIYGLVITRLIPKNLAALNEEIIYERIPAFRRQLAQQARLLVLGVASQNETLAEFYRTRLAPFLERPRGFAYAIRPTGSTRRGLLTEINDLNRYLSDDEREIGSQLGGIVRKKDDLDYHQAMQGRLKMWLFLHVGFTYSLLLVSVVHGILAHAFAGS